MLAVINTPGDAEPVALGEVEEPNPAANEALVQVAAFSLNRGELAQLSRLERGWRPGQDMAGTVLRQASDGSGPPAGARIMGLTEEAGWAERTPVRTDRMAVISDDTRFEDAAVLPIPGLTALRALRRGGLLLDKKVMITGATGIVGSLAVELATLAGARVTAVARPEASSQLRDRGASEVIEAPTATARRFALILESIGGASLKGAMERIAPAGTIVVYGNTSREPTPFDFRNFGSAQNARIETLFHYSVEPPSAFAGDLCYIAERLEARQITPVISGEHDWSELPSVVTELTTGRFRGKHVFRITRTR
ncbi:MAG TPA: zinc-binding dehydrogenase [Xanthobacteraceae bacterium]|jgi:NADPH:quinone reductase-like Zn-dependent oxidoreductase